MSETATISIPEIIKISEETNLILYRNSIFVPDSELVLGEKIKSVKLFLEEGPFIVSSEKKSKRVVGYTLETKEQLLWGDLNTEKIFAGALNIDQINYFVSKNKSCVDKCTIVVPVEGNGRVFLISPTDTEKCLYREISLIERIPEGKVKIFFAVN